jgi:ABC-type branched-subunit amino acid transport system substrate-binding protein
MRTKLFAFTALASLAAAACSLIVERGAEQCSTDADCQNRGPLFAGTVCGADKTCAPPPDVFDGGSDATPDTGPQVECTTNEQCISMAAGAASICRKDTNKCVPVLVDGCETVRSWNATGAPLEGADAVRDDDTVLIGSLVALRAPGFAGARSLARAQGAELAVNELMTNAGGLPPAPGRTKRRPVAIVSCNDYELISPTPPVPAAQRSANQLWALGVPAVMGANTSGTSTLVLPSLPKRGVFLIAPTATSATLTSADDDGLFFRTAPSDEVQSIPLADRIMAAAPDVSTKKVFVMYTNDTYGQGLYSSTVSKLTRNGLPLTNDSNAPYLKATPYPFEASADLSTFVAQALTFKPDVVVLFGNTFAVTNFVVKLESQWSSTGAPRPTYIGSDAYKGATAAITADEGDGGVGSSPPFRSRFEGTAPGRATATTQSFVIRFEPRYGPDYSKTFGTANAYDGAYVILYGLAATAGKPATGKSVAEGVTKLVGGANKYDVGPTDMNKALSALTSGQSIDLNGASGPLDFDSAGDIQADIEVWCVMPVPPPLPTAPEFRTTARFYNSTSKAMEGDHAINACP